MKIENLDFSELLESLLFLHVIELRNYCEQLNLSTKGKKLALAHRIIHLLKTGERIEAPKYPDISCAKSKNPLISPNSLILKGSYKNDLKTRLFFRSLIGQHFNFTAFGIDWIEELWLAGHPPTYQEFADMWQAEFISRKKNGSVPKQEWAFINFVKQYGLNHPNASQKEIIEEWKAERNLRKKYVAEQLKLKTLLDYKTIKK